MKVRLNISGMHCVDCAATVEKALQSSQGVTRARVSYLKKVAEVEVAPGTQVETLVQAVQKAGYGAELLGAAS